MDTPINPNDPQFDKKNAFHWLGFINYLLKILFNLFHPKK